MRDHWAIAWRTRASLEVLLVGLTGQRTTACVSWHLARAGHGKQEVAGHLAQVLVCKASSCMLIAFDPVYV